MSAIDELQRDIKELEGDFGSRTFTWGGSTYACVSSSEDRGIQIELGGNTVEISLSLIVRNELFTTPPASMDKITFNGSTFIVATAQDIQGKLTKLTLVDENT